MKVLVAACLALAVSMSSPAHAQWFYPGKTLTLPDGRTLIPGMYFGTSDFRYTWLVVRANADGTADKTFNGGGAVAIPFFHDYEGAWLVAVQPDQRIVVVGSVTDPTLGPSNYGDRATMTAIARLTPSGALDTTFNGTGKLVISLGGAEELPTLPDIAYLNRFELDDEGRITIFGFPDTPAARVNPDGTFDRTLPTTLTPREYRPAQRMVIEAYNAALDHYFITWQPDEIEALAAGASIKGWTATGQRFKAYADPREGTSAICRFYIPPALGDSHFFGRSEAECSATAAAHSAFVLESGAFMHLAVPQQGTCKAGTTPVYRLFNNRPDANHRYTTDPAVRDLMVANGWIAEGDGPDRVAMCAPI